MRRRHFWWRNPDPELELELPPDEIDIDAELMNLGQEVPSSVDEDLLDLEVPEEDYESYSEIPTSAFPWVKPAKKARGRPKKIKEITVEDSSPMTMTLEQAQKLVRRKRGRGRPSADMAAKLSAARRLLGLGTGQRLRVPASRKISAASKPVRAAKVAVEKQMSEREALKIVAKFAGKRGKRSAEFKAALNVLCASLNRYRRWR